MNNLVEYAIKSGISLTVLYLFYWLMLRRDTHFRINRLVLMGSVFVSMILPLVASGIFKAPQVQDILPSLSISIASPSAQPGIHGGSMQIVDEVIISGEKASLFSNLNIWKILTLIYISGAFIVIARLIYQAIFLHAIARLSDKINYNGYTIVSMTTDMVPFSYFNRIFISASKMDKSSFDSIIAHEQSHLSQGHFIDLFIIEIISALQWFNPVIWLFERSIKEVHEYLADEAVLETGQQQGRYQALLVNQAFGGPVFILTNQFNQSLIKKRIMMMKNKKTSRGAKLKPLLIVPLIAGLLLAFANPPMISQTDGNQITIKGNVSDRFSGRAIAGANLMIKGTTIGTITDLQGNYQLIVNSADDALIVTVAGYRTQVIPVGKNSKINVQLEQDIVAIDFNKENQFVLRDKPANKGKDEIEGKQGSTGSFIFVEEMPAYPGGTLALNKFILENIKYPTDAKKAGLEGTVLVSYIIDSDGELKSIQVIRGLGPEMDNEALRVTKMIKGWKPANQGGRPIATLVTMPVEFKLANQ
jgi:TonB family protein